MKHFTDYETQEQDYAVKVMRADYDCKRTSSEWLKAAIAINHVVTLATMALPEMVVKEIARQAGEQIK